MCSKEKEFEKAKRKEKFKVSLTDLHSNGYNI